MKHRSYQLRKVEGDDEEVAELLKSLHDEIFGSSAPQIDPEHGWWWLASDGREVAGFCGITQVDQEPLVGYLKRAGVLVPHRGRGLQRRMVRVREALARRQGMVRTITDTTDNPSSSNTLIGCGYRLYRPEEPWAFEHSLYWYKDLI